MIRIVTLYFLLILSHNLFAQGYIKGEVLDSMDYSDITGKIIFEADTLYQFTITSDGKFKCDSLKQGEYTIVLEKPGYLKAVQRGIIVLDYKYTLLEFSFIPIKISRKNKRKNN